MTFYTYLDRDELECGVYQSERPDLGEQTKDNVTRLGLIDEYIKANKLPLKYGGSNDAPVIYIGAAGVPAEKQRWMPYLGEAVLRASIAWAQESGLFQWVDTVVLGW